MFLVPNALKRLPTPEVMSPATPAMTSPIKNMSVSDVASLLVSSSSFERCDVSVDRYDTRTTQIIRIQETGQAIQSHIGRISQIISMILGIQDAIPCRSRQFDADLYGVPE